MTSEKTNADTTSPRRDYRQEVTDSIVKMLEEGVAPWQKPWQATAMPFNPTTDKPYRGGNAVHLMATAIQRGFEDPRWMTYKQAAQNGFRVRQGEKGTHIEFWEIKQSKDTGKENTNANENDQKEAARRLIHRVYTVFNAKQIEGVPPYEPKNRSAFETVESGERILANCGARIAHDQHDRAFYSRATDSIHLPPKNAFHDAPSFFGTALHELAHWTGHSSRLNRPTLNEAYRFGDTNYAKEELRAELASVFLAAELGVPHDPANHAAYVGSWIEALNQDKNEISGRPTTPRPLRISFSPWTGSVLANRRPRRLWRQSQSARTASSLLARNPSREPLESTTNEMAPTATRLWRTEIGSNQSIVPRLVRPSLQQDASRPTRLGEAAQVAKSKTRLRFIFGLKWKSKLSSVLRGSRKAACLRRRSSRRSPRRVNSSLTRHEIRSIGAMASAWA